MYGRLGAIKLEGGAFFVLKNNCLVFASLCGVCFSKPLANPGLGRSYIVRRRSHKASSIHHKSDAIRPIVY